MNTTLSSRRHRHITKLGLSLLIVALIVGMTGCATGSARPVRYDLTLASAEGGSVTVPGEGTFTCDTGRVVDLMAIPASGYRFVNWTGGVSTIANVNAASTTVTMNDDYSITANFEQTAAQYYTLTIGVTGSGSTSPAVGPHTYVAGTVVPLIATPAGGYRFVNWTAPAGSFANANVAETTFTMPGQSVTVTANFEPSTTPRYNLTMAVAPGGSGTATDLTNASPYTAGTGVSIKAVAAAGYQFVSWTAPAGTFANANAAQTTFTMPGQHVTVTANFEPSTAPRYNLTMAVAPGGSGTATDLTNASPYTAGTGVSIKAVAAAGYHFVNWSAPAGSFANANAAQTTFTMPGQSVTVTAHFEVAQTYTLTMAVAPPGSGTATDQTGTGPYQQGAQVSIKAQAVAGYHFVNWSAPAGSFANANAAQTTFTMPAQSVTVTAHFEVAQTYTLTMAVAPAGSGTATDETGTGPYQQGAQVSIKAQAAAGYHFVNWTAPAGSFANANAAQTTFTMPAQHVTITANFAAGNVVVLPDPNLEAAIREAIGRPTGPIYESDLEGLTSLSATYRGITDLTGLEHCINLVSLDLRDNQISDISPLAGLTKLEWLDLSYNLISNISPLAGLTNLKWLYLYNNLISNISPLANLTNLLYLYLHSNQISNISPLANLTNLTRLLLFSNQISDISPLTNLTKLTWLYLHNNQISNISVLASLTNLTQLDLSDNQVTGIAPLANLTDLTYLSLHSNQISDISPLANLTNLMWVYLENNLIADIYPLVQNGGLGMGDGVYLDGNPLSEDSVNTYIPELVARGVIVSY